MSAAQVTEEAAVACARSRDLVKESKHRYVEASTTNPGRESVPPTPPGRLSIYPLPDTALLPGEGISILVIEGRFQNMIRKAMQTDRVLGLAMMRPGWEDNYADPPIFEHGGQALIMSAEELDASGELSVELLVQRRFTVRRVIQRRPTIEAEVSYPQCVGEGYQRLPLEDLLALATKFQRKTTGKVAIDLKNFSFSDPEGFIDRLACMSSLRPDEKQAMLEAETIALRYHRLRRVLANSLFAVELTRLLSATPPTVLHAN